MVAGEMLLFNGRRSRAYASDPPHRNVASADSSHRLRVSPVHRVCTVGAGWRPGIETGFVATRIAPGAAARRGPVFALAAAGLLVGARAPPQRGPRPGLR